MEERRHSRRAAPADDVRVKIGGNRPARMVDVTADGASLELASALNPRGECHLALPLPAGLLRIKARVIHCKLVGFAGPGSGGRLVYRAGVRFLDVDPKLAVSITNAYPAPILEPDRREPIGMKLDVGVLEHAPESGAHGAN